MQMVGLVLRIAKRPTTPTTSKTVGTVVSIDPSPTPGKHVEHRSSGLETKPRSP